MARAKKKSRRYTKATDPRGSVVRPHQNSLAARDPTLLSRVRADFRGLGTDEAAWRAAKRVHGDGADSSRGREKRDLG